MSDPLPTPKSLARTYQTPSYEDPWDAVEDYQRVLEYTANHPDLGSSAVSSRTDLPRSRIRPWMNGSRPDVVHGIQTAQDNGWLQGHAQPEDTEPIRRGLVELAAWALSGGNLQIEPDAHVYFTIPDGLHDEFERIADSVGISYELIREDETSRSTEARPSEDGAVLARVLAAMGVPTGGKSIDGPHHLPEFAQSLDASPREAFTRVYVSNRGAVHQGKATLTVREERPESYLQDLTMLLQRASGEPVTRTGKTITISADAARAILD